MCGAIGVAILVLVIYAGFAGEQSPSSNIAPVIVFVTFWVGFVPVSVLFGNIYAAFNPWRAIGRVAFRTARRPYPAGLGRWPASIVLIGFTTFELAVRQASAPEKVAVVALGYTVVTLVAMAIYGVDVWVERGEGFAVYFDLFSRMAVFGREGDDIVLRAPLSALPRLAPLPGTTMVVAVMIGSLTYDGMAEASFYQDIAQAFRDGAGSLGASDIWQAQIAAFLGLMGAILVVLALYGAGCIGASMLDPSMTPGSVANAFAHSLVPIAFAYVSAHYFTFLVFQGQTIIPLASDPFGSRLRLLRDGGRDDRLRRGRRRQRLVHPGHPGGRRPRAGARPGPRPRARPVPHAARCGALAVLDARRDGGVHVARPVPPQPGECLTEVEITERARTAPPLACIRAGRAIRAPSVCETFWGQTPETAFSGSDPSLGA